MSLPGADELFRTTGGMALQSSSPRRPPVNGDARVPGPAGESDPAGAGQSDGASASGGASPDAASGSGSGSRQAAEHAAADAEAGGHRTRSADGDQAAAKARGQQEGQPSQQRPAGQPAGAQPRRRGSRGANRRPSGRERHDEKITVYVSAEELMDLEHARLVLRGEHGLAVDRGRIVREAVAVVLADLESRGDASILVRRLRGR
ncbi:hypothetical protein J7I98_20955 [Streptomyces sp. ISL-98]|uniref:hypothetical protein n=1 Tax=Streptomyces sp. ISL-98 TaxID=2819192 RepID=UPI001BEACB66|nr:hypothetical protein [Streptomyces sp. ISL-98]MBT2508313.1 hypothetical protein [Streptomyces sp. ISL-98]